MSDENAGRRGLMLILSSPSGAGKTTLSRRLLEEEPDLELSISATTRPARPGEVDGVDYRFVDKAAFQKMADDGALLEYASVFGHSYGTPRAPVETALEAGRDVIFDIDWQGTQQLKQSLPQDVVRIFVLPPSIEELAARLRRRGQDAEEVVQGRMARAKDEISHWAEYDYVLVNRDIEACLAEIRGILHAERMRRMRRPGLTGFVKGLMDEAP